ncbi:hypothetical protein HID58_089992 [Brassica napus]|uniref:Uncharacterized protein n=1 Tax=Brassica napus TaxID=3708 RepID=A0ABQ7Y3E2_BRANA|nr:hypothetical protein HID58_089992 [Brassica napus]
MGNIFCYLTTGWRSNVPPATETTTVQPRSQSQSVVNQSVSSASKSISNHSSPKTMAEPYRSGRKHKTGKKIRQRQRMMDGEQDTTRRQVEEHENGSCQDVSRANGVSAEITEEISPSQHNTKGGGTLEQEDDFLRANGSFTLPTPSPVTKRIGRRVGSMSPSSLRRRTSLKNFFNFKGQNNDADIEEGVGLVYDGRDKYNIPRTWSLTNLLTPRKFKQTESLPFMIKLHPWSVSYLKEIGLL